MKYLAIFLLIWLLYFLFKNKINLKAKQAKTNQMLKCDGCSEFFMQSDLTIKDNKKYCQNCLE